MRKIVFGLVAIFCLAPVVRAGAIAGRVIGWSSGGLSTRPAAVWVEGVTATPAPKSKLVMAQRGGQFVPSFLIVVVGQTVEMPNLDEVAHNIYSTSPAKTFNLGFYAKGEFKSVTFDRLGLVEAGCSIHSFMRAKILVVPNTLYAPINPDGSFRIRDVPPGQYTLEFWADGMSPQSQQVNVPANGGAPLELHVVSNKGQP